MSSALHGARCVRRADRVVEIELTPSTATGAHFPLSDFFAFALLHEAATSTVYSAPGRVIKHRFSAPIGRLLTADRVNELGCRPADDPERLALTKRCIVRADYCATRSWKPSVFTMDPTGTFVGPSLDHADSRSRSAHAALQAAFDASLPRSAAHCLTATLRIETTDASWCAHLDVPMFWDVYVFDEGMKTFV